MKRERKSARISSTVKLECAHYWIIESPDGPSSKGICKYCGNESEFNNYMAGISWLDQKIKPLDKMVSGVELVHDMHILPED